MAGGVIQPLRVARRSSACCTLRSAMARPSATAPRSSGPQRGGCPAARDVGLRSTRMAPVGTGDITPPLGQPARTIGGVGHREHHGTRQAHLRWQVGMLCRIHRSLGHRHVAARLDEGREFIVAHLGAVHPKTGHRRAAYRLFLRVDGVAEGEVSTRDPHHAGVRSIRGERRDGALQHCRSRALCGLHACAPEPSAPDKRADQQQGQQRGQAPSAGRCRHGGYGL